MTSLRPATAGVASKKEFLRTTMAGGRRGGSGIVWVMSAFREAFRSHASAFRAAFRSKRVALCIPLGFASGLPFSMRGTTLSAWMTNAGVDLKVISSYTAIGLFFTLKPLWAPVLDRYSLPGLAAGAAGCWWRSSGC
jgi:hypothetical protein